MWWGVLYFLFFLVSFAYGGETSMEIEQDSPNPKKAVQTAIKEVSNNLMEQFIEPVKLKERKKQIQKIISTYSNRYILHTQTDPPVKKEDNSFVINVTIGFSEENLKKILLEEDLFYSGASQLRILPLILFEDLVRKESYGWWKKKKASSEDIKQQISALLSEMQSVFLTYGFFSYPSGTSGPGLLYPRRFRV